MLLFIYFPIQKSLKITSNKSSTLTEKVISPIDLIALLNSSEAKTISLSQ